MTVKRRQTNQTGMVYAMTNAAQNNEVVAFRRSADGTLARVDAYPTGGNGTGTTEISPATPQDGIDPLASQGSLILSGDGNMLFAVNAGSGSISSFRVAANGILTLVDVQLSGGAQPNSLSVSGNLLYVSNVGNAANNYHSNVTGFRVQSDGKIRQIPYSTHALSVNNAQPACVTFSLNGHLLFVTEITTNKISAFRVNADGTLAGPVVNNSSGQAPFGMALLRGGQLLVAEASGALSSYAIALDGTLALLSGSVSSTQAATCWVVTTRDERFAYTSNTGSGTVSSYRIGSSGTLTLDRSAAGTQEGPDSGPIDNGVSRDGRNLYVLNGGLGSITSYRIESDGQLVKLATTLDSGLPKLGSQGLAVR